MMAAIVVCGALVFTSCSSDDDDAARIIIDVPVVLNCEKPDYL